MKRKIIITLLLFIFSILYIKNAVYITRENDNLMKEIKNNQEKYNINPIDAIITEHTMIPGINGQKVNIKKSYNNMKGINKFKESLIIFDKIEPKKSINNIYDKVIISGNPNKNKISILTTLDKNYCYTEKISIKKVCKDNNRHTILIHRISNNYLNNIKEMLENGQIYYLDSIKEDELSLINKFIKNNNYKIVSINKLIEE